MNIIITAKGFKLTDGLKANIDEKFSRFEKVMSPDEIITIVLESKKYGQKIEVTMTINNRWIKAESIDEDLYVAIGLVVDKLKKQIKKYSDRIYSKENIPAYFHESEVVEQKDEVKIVKRKYVALKPMTEEEAMLQMELLGHKSFMFFNADEELICMLYKRNDGDYGILVQD